jgi:hypothetical protein
MPRLKRDPSPHEMAADLARLGSSYAGLLKNPALKPALRADLEKRVTKSWEALRPKWSLQLTQYQIHSAFAGGSGVLKRGDDVSYLDEDKPTGSIEDRTVRHIQRSIKRILQDAYSPGGRAERVTVAAVRKVLRAYVCSRPGARRKDEPTLSTWHGALHEFVEQVGIATGDAGALKRYIERHKPKPRK